MTQSAITSASLAAQGFRPLPLPVAATEVLLHTNPFSPTDQGSKLRLAEDQVMTLAAIVEAAHPPEAFWRHGVVEVTRRGRSRVMERCHWAKDPATGKVPYPIRLKASADDPITIRLFLAPQGGRGGGKKILAVVATIALIAIGAFITGGALAGFGGLAPGLFGAGSVSAQILAGAVTFLGRIAVSMLLTPAGRPKDEGKAPDLGQAGASGNAIEPGGIFYRVAGRRRVFPQLASLPLVELQDLDEIVEATYRLSGPHRLEELEIEDTPAAKINNLEWRMHEGQEPQPQRLITRYGYQTTPQAEMKAHRRNQASPERLDNQNFPEESLPEPFTFTSQRDPDEIWMQLLWPGGMSKSDAGTPPQCLMSFRITLEQVDTGASFNLPELMFSSSYIGRISKMIVLTWADPPNPIPYRQFTDGALYAFDTVPAQTVTPAGAGGWQAHASFVNPAAGAWKPFRVEQQRDRFIVYLDPAVFPRGKRWRVSLRRSCLTRYNDYGAGGGAFNAVAYSSSATGDVYDLFGFMTASGIHYTANGNGFYSNSVQEACVLMRVASVWNRNPNPEAGDAVIEVKGRNVNLTQAAVIAAGLVPLWNGAAFGDPGVSENPADHFHDVLTGLLTEKPVPRALVNTPELAAWRQDCTAQNLRVALICDGRSWPETLNAIAACGRARLKAGRLWGVSRTRDTFALNVLPRQVFSHLNMTNFRWEKPLGGLPDAVRVRYPDRLNKWQADFVEVRRPGIAAEAVARIINMEAAGQDDRQQVIGDYSLYLAGLQYRDVIYSFDTWAEGLDLIEGAIIGISHIKLSGQMASGRLTEVERNGSNEVTAITITAQPDGPDGADLAAMPDVAALQDLAETGLKLAVTIATGAGLTTQPVTLSGLWQDGPFAKARLAFAAPVANPDIRPSQMALVGQESETYRRFEVTSVRPLDGLKFTVTCVDEAPAIHAHVGA